MIMNIINTGHVRSVGFLNRGLSRRKKLSREARVRNELKEMADGHSGQMPKSYMYF